MPFAPNKIRVGVLRGGPSPEYDVSLNTGKTILANLSEPYEPIDILISKDGAWHERGMEKSPGKILGRLDVVFNGLHGAYGEDGTVQKILESHKIPYTGSDALSSAICMNKIAAKKIYARNGLRSPHSVNIPFESLTRDAIRDAYESVPAPFAVKPSASGSSVGVYVVHSLGDLEEAVVAASLHSPSVLIEEFIEGKEATCGVIDGFRNQDHYTLLPIEIRHGKDFFDYDAKYYDGTEEISPGNFSESETALIKDMALQAHKTLGLRHYSRSDFRVHPRRGVFILETNSLPGLTENSLIPKSVKAVGSNIKEFLSHLLDITLKKN